MVGLAALAEPAVATPVKATAAKLATPSTAPARRERGEDDIWNLSDDEGCEVVGDGVLGACESQRRRSKPAWPPDRLGCGLLSGLRSKTARHKGLADDPTNATTDKWWVGGKRSDIGD